MSNTMESVPIGVEAALRAAADPSFVPKPTLFEREFSLEGRVAVVTGGGRGLGLEMAEALAEAGATVYCVARSTSPTDVWKSTQAYVSKLGVHKNARLEYKSVDVSNQNAIWSAMEEIAQKEGRLDICIAAAGVAERAPCLDLSAEQFEEVMAVDVNGTFYTAQGAARQMTKLGKPGSIILVASIAGHGALQGAPTIRYCTSKAASIQMARSLACELAANGIRVNSVSPGYFATE